MQHPKLQQASAIIPDAAQRAARYLEGLDQRAVIPSAGAIEQLSQLDGPLPLDPCSASEVLACMDELASPATIATAGARYFGFVIGGTLPAALGANMLAAAWDQVAGLERTSPAAVQMERVAGRWLLEALSFPASHCVSFTSGATMANFSGLLAARHALLEQRGWDVERDGLFGAPPIDVIVGDEVHASVIKALGMIGFGRERILRVPIDDQGRMRVDRLPTIDESSLVIIQAGNVNTGAFDAGEEIIEHCQHSGSWVHVDGAFGLWAAAAPGRAHLMRGFERADSFSVDGHKWLNVPYDSGMAICRHPETLRAAMSIHAPYLVKHEIPDPADHTPEMSRRGRGIEVWAALKSLGRSGLADLIEGCCVHATRLAEGLAAQGHEVLNQVELNQVLVSFGSDAETERAIAAIQADGICWASGTTWRGRSALRLSVSSWATTEDDIERSLESLLRNARPRA